MYRWWRDGINPPTFRLSGEHGYAFVLTCGNTSAAANVARGVGYVLAVVMTTGHEDRGHDGRQGTAGIFNEPGIRRHEKSVDRGGIDPPTFRFSGENRQAVSSPAVSPYLAAP